MEKFYLTVTWHENDLQETVGSMESVSDEISRVEWILPKETGHQKNWDGSIA